MCKERLDVVNVSCVSGFEVKVCSFVNTTAVVKTDLTINCVCVVWVGRGLEQIYTMLKHMVLFTSLNSCCLVAQSDLRGQTSCFFCFFFLLLLLQSELQARLLKSCAEKGNIY